MTMLGSIEIMDAAIMRCHWLPCWPRNMFNPSGTVAMFEVFTMINGRGGKARSGTLGLALTTSASPPCSRCRL
jgi:hypothetical protein